MTPGAHLVFWLGFWHTRYKLSSCKFVLVHRISWFLLPPPLVAIWGVTNSYSNVGQRTLSEVLRKQRLLLLCVHTRLILQSCQNLLFFLLLVAIYAPTVLVSGVLVRKIRVTVHSDEFLGIYHICAIWWCFCYLRRSDAHSLADCGLRHLAAYYTSRQTGTFSFNVGYDICP